MRLEHETTVGFGALMALQLVLAALAIVILTRMGPAIGQILQENVASAEAVEAMLAAMATPGEHDQRVSEFGSWLSRAEDNVTEPAEEPLLAIIRDRHERALADDAAARAEVIRTLVELANVNRRSMIRADERARRLSQTGAWAASFLGAITLALGVLIYRRMRLRIELPIRALVRTMRQTREGNSQARCGIVEGPSELIELANDTNWLLDERMRVLRGPVDPIGRLSTVPATSTDEDIRRALAVVLDRTREPIVIHGADGNLVAASQAAMDRGLPKPAEIDTTPEGEWRREPIPDTELSLVFVPTGSTESHD